jgi:lysophospholipase L1-like esterase
MTAKYKKRGILLISFLVILLLGACGADESVDENVGSTVDESDVVVAAVGDSITNFSVSGANYPDHLDEMLGEDYAVLNFGEANHAAQASSDFPYETTDSYAESLSSEPDIVLFMLGTNDTKSENWQGAERFKEEYTDLLEDYLELESVSRVILVSPPSAFLNNPLGGGIDPANLLPIRDVVQEVAEENNLEFVDMYEETAGHEEWFFDGIHPNQEGAEQIANIFYNEIKN